MRGIVVADYSRFCSPRPSIEPSYLVNRPREGFCFYHRKFCHAVMTWEVSWREDFPRVKYWVLCMRAAEELPQARESTFVRKWQVPASTIRLGEENMHHQDFCFYHLRREGRRIQTRRYTVDVLNGITCSPMCDEAHEELARAGYEVTLE